jgi:nitroreductase
MKELIQKRRTIRRFLQKPIPLKQLENFVDAARLAPSAANLQPLEYIIVHQPELLKRVFGTLKWAGYIRPLGDPPESKWKNMKKMPVRRLKTLFCAPWQIE